MNSPEHGLWMGVICQAFTDAEQLKLRADYAAEHLRSMKDPGMKELNQKVYRNILLDIRQLESELKSQWFQTICTYIDIHHDWIMSTFYRKLSPHVQRKGTNEARNFNSRR